MKRFLKPLWIGLLIGAVELGAVGLMAGVGKWAAFEDLAFGFGIATLLLALLVLFSGRRVQAGMNISPNNAGGQDHGEAAAPQRQRRAERRRLRGCRRGVGGLWRQFAVLTVLPWNAG